MEAEIIYKGSSRDGRTNAWALQCKCGHRSDLQTTMMGKRVEYCEKCFRAYLCKYNDQEVVEIN